MSFRDFIKDKDDRNSHTIDIGFNDNPTASLKKKQHAKAHMNGNGVEKGDDPVTLGEEIAEFLRLAHSNMNQVETLTTKLGTKSDTHDLREKMYSFFLKENLIYHQIER